MSGGDALRRQALDEKLPPLVPTTSTGADSQRTAKKRGDNMVLGWWEFFDEKRVVVVENGQFNVYFKGKIGPILYLLHGGGYSGLTWACFAEEIAKIADFRIIAPDLRGHGDTVTEEELELSTEQQTEDIGQIYNKIIDDYPKPPPVVMMGHSMGGALAVHTAAITNLIPNLVGLIVVDVVEGSAMGALHFMHDFLRNRPSMFHSESEAIDWCVRSGTVRNYRSARVSMPSQLRQTSSSTSALSAGGDTKSASLQQNNSLDVVNEEQSDDGKGSDSLKTDSFCWRIDLVQTDRHWKGWFQGLSQKFLAVPATKMLLLAGTDRLDKDLTIGQMQGKFQMVVLPKVGHALQEDSPAKVAATVAAYCIRNKFVHGAKPGSEQFFKPSLPGC